MSVQLIKFFKSEAPNMFYNFKINVANECPHCHAIMNPDIILKTLFDDKLKSNIAALFQCPACRKYFVNEYSIVGSFSATLSGYETNRILYTYKTLMKYDLPDELSEISPSFKEIYTQSLTAEFDGLSQITGLGYRKAIEFLIKDYLISINPEDEEKIKKLKLSHAIDKIDSDKIKDLAKASIWIGNDETHYIRKFQDKDITDMKRFIRSLAYYITHEITAIEANKFINA